jgi:hypothetical protein
VDTGVSGRGEIPFAEVNAPPEKARTEEAFASPVLNLVLKLNLVLMLQIRV